MDSKITKILTVGFLIGVLFVATAGQIAVFLQSIAIDWNFQKWWTLMGALALGGGCGAALFVLGFTLVAEWRLRH